MNKDKGFTLIELIGIIILLTVISLIVFPIILNSIKNTEKQLSEATKTVILSGATSYITMYQNSFRKTDGNVYCITLRDLAINGDISSNMELQKENISLSSYVQVNVVSGKYEFDITNECVATVDKPNISLSVIGNPFNRNGWAKNDFYINIVGTGTSYKYCIDDALCTPNLEMMQANGTAYISNESATNYVCAQAIIGEVQSDVVCSDAYKLDKTPPIITGLTDIEADIGSIVDLKSGVASSDNLSGLEGTFSYSPEVIDTTKMGVSNVTYRATDLADNTIEVKRKITVLSTAPDITYAVVGNPINSYGWANDNFYVKASAIDNSGKGIKQVKYCYSASGECTPTVTSTSFFVDVLVSNESINNKICMQATDNQNKESKVVCSDTYKIDKQTPTISSKVSYYVVVTPNASVSSIGYFNYANRGASNLVGTNCIANSTVANNTSSLPIGEYTLNCTVTKENGKSTSASIRLDVSNCFTFTSSSGNISNYHCYQGNTGGYLVKSDVKIPYSINQSLVRAIGSTSSTGTLSFRGKRLTNIDFSNAVSLTNIGNYAFKDNNIQTINLKNLSLLTNIGSYAFYNNQINNVDFSSLAKLTSIGSYAFYRNIINAVNFTNLSKVTTIGSYAFANNQLMNLNLSPLINLTSISSGTFTNNQIKSVDFTNLSKVTTIGSSAFSNNAITSLNLNPLIAMTIINSSAFYNNQITTVNFTGLSKLTTIGSSAFSTNLINAVNLSPLVALTKINSSAFYNNKITSVNFTGLSQLTTIGSSAFSTNLISSVNFSPLVALTLIDNSAFYNNKITSVNFTNNTNLTRIGDAAFAYNKLTSVNFSPLTNLTYLSGFEYNNISSVNVSNLSKVEQIGYRAFEGNSLTSFNFPIMIKLVKIDSNAFYLNQLTSVDFSKNLELISIGNQSFRTNRLTSVNFNNLRKLTTIYSSAFDDNDLTSINFSSLINLVSIGKSAFFRNKISNINLSPCISLTTIGEEAFGENKATSLNLGSGKNITSIGGGAFADNSLPESQAWIYNRTSTGEIDNTRLSSYGGTATSVSIPNTVIEIMNYAFKSEDLTSLNLRNNTNLQRIGVLAFSDNTLTSLTFPTGNKLVEIGDGAFAKNRLPDSQAWIYAKNADGTNNNTILVSYGGANTSVSIPSNVVEITSYCFHWTSHVTNINFQNAVNLAKIGNEAFNSVSISTLDLSKNLKLTFIGNYAFNHSDINTAQFASTSNLEISYGTFWDCKSLRKIVNRTGRSYDWSGITRSNVVNQNFVTGTIIHQNGNISVTAS